MDVFISVLESLYCNGKGGDHGKQVCNVECRQMGVILWAQGALEEAVKILGAFARPAGKIMGKNDV